MYLLSSPLVIVSVPLCQFLPHHLLVMIDNDILVFFGSTQHHSQQLPSPHLSQVYQTWRPIEDFPKRYSEDSSTVYNTTNHNSS